MKTSSLFENQAASQKFASADEARGWIRKHPLIGDYLLDLLIDRKVLELSEDGTIKAPLVKQPGGEKSEGKPWGKEWPSREAIIQILGGGEDSNTGLKFRTMQEKLEEMGQPCTHWVCLHALWNLQKAGVVEKLGKFYRLTLDGLSEMSEPVEEVEAIPEGQAMNPGLLTPDYRAVLDVCENLGPPYDRKEVAKRLYSETQHDGSTGWQFKPKALDKVIADLIAKDYLPPESSEPEQ